MNALHYLNASLWFANAICWTFYAHVPLLGVASLVMALGVLSWMLWNMLRGIGGWK